MQQYAGIYLLQNHSTYFGCSSHPSSGVHKSVTAASGTGCNNNGLLIIPVRSTCFGQLFYPSSGALNCVLELVV